jgi:hypothetical protein
MQRKQFFTIAITHWNFSGVWTSYLVVIFLIGLVGRVFSIMINAEFILNWYLLLLRCHFSRFLVHFWTLTSELSRCQRISFAERTLCCLRRDQIFGWVCSSPCFNWLLLFHGRPYRLCYQFISSPTNDKRLNETRQLRVLAYVNMQWAQRNFTLSK